jgi:DNA mismatch repair protein MutS
MMEQYRSVKARYRDAVLFFRLGDFYEMFFEDALEVSALLDLTLTHRQGEPMCGIPYHAAKPYIARLLKHGKKVAVCEQLEQAGSVKGIVRRDVVEVVTPGTTVEDDFLEQTANNYIVAICRLRERICLAWLEVSTGDFRAFSRPDPGGGASCGFVAAELSRLMPRELLIQQSLLESPELAGLIAGIEGLMVGKYPDWSFDASMAASELSRRFGLASLKGFGFSGEEPELAAASFLAHYVDETVKTASPQISSILPYDEGEFVGIDEGSGKNLEILRNLSDSGKNRSLLGVLDATKSASGARLLRQWLSRPLASCGAANERLDAVEFLYRDQTLLNALRESLGRVLDIERLASRTAMDKAHARDLLAIRDSIAACVKSGSILEGAGAPEILWRKNEGGARDAALGIAALIDSAIKDDPALLITEGNLIRSGHDARLDELHAIKRDSAAVLDAYLEEERAASGIPNLRVRYNRIIGYYLEVSKGKLESVPPHFIRRQSLVTGERYTTTRLSELESEINGATERIVELEKNLFLALREKVKSVVPELLAMGKGAAIQDCLASFAWVATARGYSKPRLSEGKAIHIREGRHPVVEAWLGESAFVPNGLDIDASGASFALITGPNMAGKSTFLRQTALIVLMAQCGSFVPADDAEIGVVDRIFCRVGAQDNLARGESTFLVEMHETAHILNTATADSLVIMDEVGRGTSTVDGLAIAWAVSERLLDSIQCRTLFATHYHELTALEHPRLFNLSPAVLEEEGDIVFLKRMEPKPATGSFGLHVARLAGMPPEVVKRALAIQLELKKAELALPGHTASGGIERSGGSVDGTPLHETPPGNSRPLAGITVATHGRSAPPPLQSDLFSPGDLVLAEIAGLDPESMTPLKALNKLAEFRERLQSRGH